MAMDRSREHGPFYCEKMVQCPLNRAHIILESRLQFHITRCMQNYPGVKFIRCPFNATHVLLPPETLENHLDACPDNNSVLNYKYRTQSDIFSRMLPVENRQIACDEDWSDANCPTYDPSKKLKNCAIPPMLKVASKSEKRKYRKLLEKQAEKKTDPYYDGMALTDSEDEEDHTFEVFRKLDK